jgi:phage gp29-like protein
MTMFENLKAALVKKLAKPEKSGRVTPISDRSEIPLSFAGMDVDQVASVIRQSENGNSVPFWRMCRTIILNDAHIQSELFKRKNAVLGDELTVTPWSKAKKDVEAADAARAMLTNLPSLMPALMHLMDAVVYPLSIVEKVFGPADPSRPELGRRTALVELVPVPYRLIGWDMNGQPVVTDRENFGGYLDVPPIDLNRYIVHRGHVLSSPDRYGGPMRTIFFLALLSAMGTTWWARYLERFGSPFIVGRVDSEDDRDRRILEAAISYANQIGGMVISNASQVELKESAGSAGDGFEKFKAHCRAEISRIILGQTLSAITSNTGMGDGTAELQGEVRQDVRKFDSRTTGARVRTDILDQWLGLNGYSGRPPTVSFTGDTTEEIKRTIDGIKSLSEAGFEPTDDAFPDIGARVGYPIQRKAAPAPFDATDITAHSAAASGGGGRSFFRREFYRG